MSDLEKPLAPIDEFQKKVIDRLRTDIRDLLPDEVLKSLVERAVEVEFFQERKTQPDQWGRFEVKPSWFVTEITKVAQPILAAAVEKFITERTEVIERAIVAFLAEERLTVLLADRLAESFDSALRDFREQQQR